LNLSDLKEVGMVGIVFSSSFN